MKKQIIKTIGITLLVIFCSIALLISVRGNSGNPTSLELNSNKWILQGPFEEQRGRFALTYSIVEDKSFYFSQDIGRFADPDVAISHGHYVSLFAPLFSFVAIPGYLIGKYFGASQVGAFSIMSLFALFNLILIRLIAIKLGAKPLAATLASLIFLFGTPAFSYAINFYQHHLSTFLILLSIWSLLKSKKPWTLVVVFFLCAASIPLDYPNLFFMAPIGLFALRRIISVERLKQKIKIKVKTLRLFTFLIMMIPMGFFLWFNQQSYGSPFQLSGTLQTTRGVSNPKDLNAIEEIKKSKAGKNKNSVGFFLTRNILNGFYVHFVSPDRGIIYYAPVVLFGFAGIVIAHKKKVKLTTLLVAVLGANILLYSMWGDPWGGWSFGSRYLIPSYAILSIFSALLLTYWKKKYLFIILFTIIALYSIGINTLGAITTSAIPPQVEVLNLEKISGVKQLYTYQLNWNILLAGNSKSFAYNTYFKPYITPLQFYAILAGSIGVLITLLTIAYVFNSRKEKNE